GQRHAEHFDHNSFVGLVVGPSRRTRRFHRRCGGGRRAPSRRERGREPGPRRRGPSRRRPGPAAGTACHRLSCIDLGSPEEPGAEWRSPMKSTGWPSTRRLAFVHALAAVLALTSTGSAAANTRQTTLVEFDGTLPDTGFCDFPVSDTEQGTFIVADQFDTDGVLFRTIVTASGQLTLTFMNPATAKSTVTHNESQVIIVDWLPDGSPEMARGV